MAPMSPVLKRLAHGLLLTTVAPWMAIGAEPELRPEELLRLPPVELPEALSTFAIRPGFRLELAAGEPEVMDPVAVCFDEKGRLYVVEMRDYSERRPERLGRVRRLEDRDGDGRFETSQVFLEGLPWPTAVTCWQGGLFVGATPDILYARDTDGDGKADLRETIFTGFASEAAPYATNQLNVQAMLNSFQWGLDTRIHGSASLSGGRVKRVESGFTRAWREQARQRGARVPEDEPAREWNLRGRDFSFDPLTLDFRTEIGGGQHGMTFDDTGRKFVCSNSDHLQWIRFEERQVEAAPPQTLPPARISIAADGPAAEVFRISPVEPWRVIRTRWRVTGLVPGLIEGGGRASGYFTSATGVTVCRGDAYGEALTGDVLVADCGSNLIHRKRLRTLGCELVGERPKDERNREFLASRDTWFRPVDFANAPDGCLWILDMYREIIEHPWSLPANLKRLLDLNAGNDRGRLYRIVLDGIEPRRRVDLEATSLPDLLATLGHPNGWHRDAASRLLCERREPAAIPRLREILASVTHDLARLHSLYVLDNLAGSAPADLALALSDPSPAVRRHGLRLVERRYDGATLPAELERPLVRCADDTPEVRLQLALTLAAVPHPRRLALLTRLIHSAEGRDGESRIVDAALAAAGDEVLPLFRSLTSSVDNAFPPAALTLAEMLGARNQAGETAEFVALLAERSKVPATWRWTARFATGLRRSRSTLRDVDPEQRLDALLDQARTIAIAPATNNGSQARQVEAIRLLAEQPAETAREQVLPILATGHTSAAQRAAIEVLLRGDIDGFTDILHRWPGLTPEARALALELVLRRPTGAPRVLEAVEKRQLQPRDLSTAQLTSLRRDPQEDTRRRAVALLGAAAESRNDAVAAMLPALNLRGDRERGRAVHLLQCAPCHRLGGEGTALGPDLESVQSQPKEKLLVAIVDPNREVAPAYLGQTVETTDDESFSGLLTAETPAALTLRQAGGVEVVLVRERIRSVNPEGRSLMPEGFESTLTPQQMADLLACITGTP